MRMIALLSMLHHCISKRNPMKEVKAHLMMLEGELSHLIGTNTAV